MKPEIYKWLTYICSTFNEEIDEYDAELTNSQFLYIVLSYFFLMDEEDLHIEDLTERRGLEGVVSALKTEVKLVTVSSDIKYLFIENPKNYYGSEEELYFRLTFVKLVKSKDGEWGRNVFGTDYRDVRRLWLLDDSYKTEEELIALLNNMNLEVSWHCDSMEPNESESAVSLAHSILEYFCDFKGSAKSYEEGINSGNFREHNMHTLQTVCHAAVILNHFAYFLKKINLILDNELIFDLENGIDLGV
jgi:hypothetical protein